MVRCTIWELLEYRPRIRQHDIPISTLNIPLSNGVDVAQGDSTSKSENTTFRIFLNGIVGIDLKLVSNGRP